MRWRARRAGPTPRSPARRLRRSGRRRPRGSARRARAPSASSSSGFARRGLVLLDLPHLRLLEERERAAGGLDLLARGRRGAVHGDRELLRELAVAEQLHVLAHRADQALRLQRLGRHLLARLEALEVADVHRLRVGAERADRHRVLRRVAAQLREAHRERHLAALEAGAHRVRARARLLALDPAAGVAALARAQAAADALAILARLRGLRLERFSSSAISASSTFTRWRTFRSMPAMTGLSSCSRDLPIRPRPSARSVPRCAGSGRSRCRSG